MTKCAFSRRLRCSVNASVRTVERINSERVVLLGWSRAILMQIAHPLIGAGVVEHSSFRGGAVQAAVRLHHTVSAMLALTFAGPDAHAAAIAGIRAIHRRVHGTLAVRVGRFPAGTRYSAEDPALLLWVHATLVHSTADIYSRIVTPLTPGELDEVCVDSLPVLGELGGDTTAAPHTWPALLDYLRDVEGRGTLALTPETRAIGLAVLAPRAAGLPLPLSGLQQLITAGLLPASLREAYGLPWDAARERRFARALAVLRRIRGLTPDALARWRASFSVTASAPPPGR